MSNRRQKVFELQTVGGRAADLLSNDALASGDLIMCVGDRHQRAVTRVGTGRLLMYLLNPSWGLIKFSNRIGLQCLTRFANVMSDRVTVNSLRDYLTVAEAAEELGVSASTLRNWDRSGKLVALRHPMNGYRLYRRSDLAALLKPLSQGKTRK